jgi:uncharacterized protein YjcR
MTKIYERDKLDLIDDYVNGMGIQRLSVRYGLSVSTVHKIITASGKRRKTGKVAMRNKESIESFRERMGLPREVSEHKSYSDYLKVDKSPIDRRLGRE